VLHRIEDISDSARAPNEDGVGPGNIGRFSMTVTGWEAQCIADIPWRTRYARGNLDLTSADAGAGRARVVLDATESTVPSAQASTVGEYARARSTPRDTKGTKERILD